MITTITPVSTAEPAGPSPSVWGPDATTTGPTVEVAEPEVSGVSVLDVVVSAVIDNATVVADDVVGAAAVGAAVVAVVTKAGGGVAYHSSDTLQPVAWVGDVLDRRGEPLNAAHRDGEPRRRPCGDDEAVLTRQRGFAEFD